MKRNIIMGILALLGISCAQKKELDKNSMLLWEDDYLMIEIMPSKNLDYAINETKRIKEFGEKHSDGIGFSDITPIGEKPYATEDLSINQTEFVDLLESIGIKKYPSLTYAGMGEPETIENSGTVAYGSHSSAIFHEAENNKIEHIWFACYDWKNLNQTKLLDGLHAIGEKYDMIMVDFASNQVVDLKVKSEIQKFLTVE